MTNSSLHWQALVLAAGFGTRLLPYTGQRPKPLFPLDNIPVIDLLIARLIRAGCGGIVINTHYLHEQLEAHFRSSSYDIPIRLVHEPEILGTGGAIGSNLAALGPAPFVVINSDIYTTIDLAAVYRFHRDHDAPVTLVLRDDPRFNSVRVDDHQEVTGFGPPPEDPAGGRRQLTFTGIHVIDPAIESVLPPAGRFADIISVYRRLIKTGGRIKAFLAGAGEWDDIGTPAAYRRRALAVMVDNALERAFGSVPARTIHPFPADGSETCWMRIHSAAGSLIACDRGLRQDPAVNETGALARILPHLRNKGVNVPRLYAADSFSGLAVMEDLGDTHLQAAVTTAGREPSAIVDLYRPVVDQLVHLAADGAAGFDPAWTCQTERYDRGLILEKECRYFTEAFLTPFYADLLPDDPGQLENDFAQLAEATLTASIDGLMHRDMQSRNIMLHQGRPFFIDLQGARLGPVQYDLASLLIDPYVMLPAAVRKRLREYYLAQFSRRRPVAAELFYRGYACCAVTRNLQILGAFGFLTRVRGKSRFADYIPAAAAALADHVRRAEQVLDTRFPALLPLAEQLRQAVAGKSGRPSA